MTIPELLPTANHEQAVPPAVPAPAQPVTAPPGPGALLRFQLNRLVGEIMADPDLDPDLYLSLLGHVAKNHGHPEQALLAHLADVQDPEDLPPFKASKQPKDAAVSPTD
jgi:hypothetical protein